MKLNKFIAILCATSMVLSFTSCSSKPNEKNKSTNEITSISTETTKNEESEDKKNTFIDEKTTPSPIEKPIIENSNDFKSNISIW